MQEEDIAQLFHLPDLHDIILNESEGAINGMNLPTEVSPVEVAKPKVGPTSPQEPQGAVATTSSSRSSSVRVIIKQVMAEMGAMIDATMEAIKYGRTPASTLGP